MGAIAEDVRVVGSLAAANDRVSVNNPGIGVVTVQLSGTFVGTVVFEVDSIEGASPGWTAVNAQNVTTGALVASATAPGIFRIDASGFRKVSAKCSIYGSGTVSVTLNASVASAAPGLTAGTGGGAVTSVDGGLATLGTTTNAGIITDANGTAIAFLRGAIIQWAAFLARLPAALISGRLDVNLGAAPAFLSAGGGAPAAPTCVFTRGANTTAYTIGDEVGTASTAPTTVSVARVNGGSGVILGAQAVYSNYPAVVPSLVLLVFSSTVTLAGDNAQLALSDADGAKLLAIIPLTATQALNYSAGSAVSSGALYLSGAPSRPAPHFVCGGSEQTLYCCLVTLNAFTPIANSETITVMLDIEQN